MRIALVLFLTLFACAVRPAVREVSIRIEAPDGGWRIAIREVHRVDDEIWVISELSREPGMAIQAITPVSDQIRLEAPDLPVRHFVTGRTWGWIGEEEVTYIGDLSALAEPLKRGTLLYRRPESPEEGPEG